MTRIDYDELVNKYYRTFEIIDNNLFLSHDSFDLLAQLLSTNSTREDVVPISSHDFMSKYKDRFDNLLRATVFVDGEDNKATEMFSSLVSRNKNLALSLIQELFLKYYMIVDVTSLTKIIKLFYDYSYSELYPYSQTIALSCRSSKSPLIQISMLNLLAHWNNRESLDLLNAMEKPSNILVNVVYESVKRTLVKKCSM